VTFSTVRARHSPTGDVAPAFFIGIEPSGVEPSGEARAFAGFCIGCLDGARLPVGSIVDSL